MLSPAKPIPKSIPLSPPPAGEVSTRALLSELSQHGEKQLIFTYEGNDVLPGYHVTEVKDGHFEALDCGANPEAWRETFVQLWDVPSEDGRSHMQASKFMAIMNKVQQVVAYDSDAKLTFEISDGSGAIRLYRAETVTLDGGHLRVSLSRRAASCKPRDRWLEEQNKCCGTSAKEQSCCT